MHKIVIIGPYPPPYGGQSVHVKELYNFLKRQRINVKVLNIGNNRKISNRHYLKVRNRVDFILKFISINII